MQQLQDARAQRGRERDRANCLQERVEVLSRELAETAQQLADSQSKARVMRDLEYEINAIKEARLVAMRLHTSRRSAF